MGSVMPINGRNVAAQQPTDPREVVREKVLQLARKIAADNGKGFVPDNGHLLRSTVEYIADMVVGLMNHDGAILKLQKEMKEVLVDIEILRKQIK